MIAVRKCLEIQGDRCYGLFTKRDIDDEVPIGEYIGEILNRQQSLGLCDCKRVYLFQITDKSLHRRKRPFAVLCHPLHQPSARC